MEGTPQTPPGPAPGSAELDERLRKRNWIVGAALAAVLAVGVAGLVIALMAKSDRATESDLTALEQRLTGAEAKHESEAEQQIAAVDHAQNKKLSNVNNRVGTLRNDLDAVQTEANNTKEESTKLSDSISSLENSVKSLEQKVDRLERRGGQGN